MYIVCIKQIDGNDLTCFIFKTKDNQVSGKTLSKPNSMHAFGITRIQLFVPNESWRTESFRGILSAFEASCTSYFWAHQHADTEPLWVSSGLQFIRLQNVNYSHYIYEVGSRGRVWQSAAEQHLLSLQMMHGNVPPYLVSIEFAHAKDLPLEANWLKIKHCTQIRWERQLKSCSVSFPPAVVRTF